MISCSKWDGRLFPYLLTFLGQRYYCIVQDIIFCNTLKFCIVLSKYILQFLQNYIDREQKLQMSIILLQHFFREFCSFFERNCCGSQSARGSVRTSLKESRKVRVVNGQPTTARLSISLLTKRTCDDVWDKQTDGRTEDRRTGFPCYLTIITIVVAARVAIFFHDHEARTLQYSMNMLLTTDMSSFITSKARTSWRDRNKNVIIRPPKKGHIFCCSPVLSFLFFYF